MSWLDRFVARLAPPARPLPRVAEMLSDLPSDREVRLVKDMVRHVLPQVAAIVKRCAATMETPAQAHAVWLEVTVQLGLEAALGVGFTAAAQQGSTRLSAASCFDDALTNMIGGLRDHRDELAAQVEAIRLGLHGGNVRDGSGGAGRKSAQ